MPLTFAQLSDEAMQLPPESRSELAEKLVETVHDHAAGPIQAAWAAEAIKRRDDVRSGRVKTIPGDQVLAEVRAMVGR